MGQPHIFRLLTAMLLVLAAVVTTGCASKITKAFSEGHLDAAIEASAKLNPDPKGRPSPVVVRIYELKSDQNFGRADFFALFDQDNTTLGQDLVARDEFKLAPGETRPYKRDLNEQTRFIGVIAAYRNIQKAQWRAVVPAPKGKKVKVVIKLDSLAVTVAKPD